MIKRIHTRLGEVGKGIGEELVHMTIALVQSQGIRVMGVGASGTSSGFFERQGFKIIENGTNPVMNERGVKAGWVYLERPIDERAE